MAIRQLARLLGLLDVHLTSSIESNEVPGVPQTGQEPEVRQDFRDRLKAREWRKLLIGNLPKRQLSSAQKATRRRKPTEAKQK